jgi:hypothetical protein
MRVEDEVVAEGMDSGDGTEFSLGEIEADAEGIAQGFGGGVEEVGEEMAAFAEDAAQDLGPSFLNGCLNEGIFGSF